MNWKFKENAKPQGGSDGFWYDLCNGYINVEEVLENPDQIAQVNEAIQLLEDLEQSLEENDLLNEF